LILEPKYYEKSRPAPQRSSEAPQKSKWIELAKRETAKGRNRDCICRRQEYKELKGKNCRRQEYSEEGSQLPKTGIKGIRAKREE
jgi:hypothetical protein